MTTLHLLGLPHTITRDDYSHCAFTGKILKFSRMMRPFGYRVLHYGVEGAESGADHQIEVMTFAEQCQLAGHNFDQPAKFHGDDANIGNALYREFNRRLRTLLPEHVRRGDLVLLPFGLGHAEAITTHEGFNVESGIGYPDSFCEHRIFESNAWMHYHQGKARREGNNYEWVIPNYFDTDAWDLGDGDGGYVLYFGRITSIKGLRTVVEIAKHQPDVAFVLCGQGDPAPFLTQPNIRYIPPVTGRARSALLGGASCVLMPSEFTEPFGGVAIEANLCGTPVLSTSFGAFTETITNWENGFRCHTLGDWLGALRNVPKLDRSAIRRTAMGRYSLPVIGRQYDIVFTQILDRLTTGWFHPRSRF